MQTEVLMGLDAAIAELGTLYTAARRFNTLHEAAEAELLPQLNALGRRLRSAARHQHLGEVEIDQAAREIVGQAIEWRTRLETVRSSAIYQQALGAFASDDQATLRIRLPDIFRAVSVVGPPTPPVYLGFSPAVRRGRQGVNPFRTPDLCATQIAELLVSGVTPEVSGSEWWDRDLPPIECMADAQLVDSVIALRISELPAALFATEGGSGLAVFTPKLRAPFSVLLAAEANDEWWQANDQPYAEFRDALRTDLIARGIAVDQN